MDKPLPGKLNVSFDGGCWNNPGGVAGYGWSIADESGNELAYDYGLAAKNCSVATNNYAEYCGLIGALVYLESKEWVGDLITIGDSQLVIYQLAGKWKCKKPHLALLRDTSLNILNRVATSCSIKWTPSRKNRRSHQLASKGLRSTRMIQYFSDLMDAAEAKASQQSNSDSHQIISFRLK